MRTFALIISLLALCLGSSSGALPVIDAASIASERLSAAKDNLEQILQEANQQTQIVHMLEQIEQIDTYLGRLGDPSAVSQLSGVEELITQLSLSRGAEGAAQSPPGDEEVFRSLDSVVNRSPDKVMRLDRNQEAERDGRRYLPEVAERHVLESFRAVRLTAMKQRDSLRKSLAESLGQLRAAKTSSEVDKLNVVISGLQAELDAVDREMEGAWISAQALVMENATEREIQRKAAIELDRATLHAGAKKDAELYGLFTEPVKFAE